ncbi:MAG: ribosome-associated translation inhibitor RaiA [Candidatus Saganbacteria bacterium]|nr:ribosome-associated translation inhibitor RaiA [Candidatus Saganbacteria bacterium]
MQIIVSGHGIDLTDALKEYATKKIAKVKQFWSNIQKAEVILDARHNKDTNRSHVAEVSMWVGDKKVIRATAVGQDMYAAIDLVLFKLEEQIKKHKAKHGMEQRRHGERIKQALQNLIPFPWRKESEPTLVRLSQPIGKPMHEDEAQFELQQSREEFHLYRDAKTHQINAIYKEKDSGFAIITPSSPGVEAISEEEAQARIEKVDIFFLPFINASSKELNIVYKRKSGNYGIIEPRL